MCDLQRYSYLIINIYDKLRIYEIEIAVFSSAYKSDMFRVYLLRFLNTTIYTIFSNHFINFTLR